MINKQSFFTNKDFSAEIEDKFKTWIENKYFKLALFNIILLMLVLLRSAGYFEPFFTISINFIVLCALFLSIILLSLGSRFMFLMALIFWIFAAIVKIFGIDIWAERIGIYTYQALVLGVILVVKESLKSK